MIFDDCFIGLDLSIDEKQIIDACIQALSFDFSVFSSVLSLLKKGDSAGIEQASIGIDSDPDEYTDGKKSYDGICFEYLGEKVILSYEKADKIISNVIDKLEMDFFWDGFH